MFAKNWTKGTTIGDALGEAESFNAAQMRVLFTDGAGIPIAAFIILRGNETADYMAVIEAHEAKVEATEGTPRDRAEEITALTPAAEMLVDARARIASLEADNAELLKRLGDWQRYAETGDDGMRHSDDAHTLETGSGEAARYKDEAAAFEAELLELQQRVDELLHLVGRLDAIASEAIGYIDAGDESNTPLRLRGRIAQAKSNARIQ